MRRHSISRHSQAGAALILLATILILGVAWFTVGALGKAAPTTAEREMITGPALLAAKKALLAYVATTAAMTSDAVDSRHANPGRLPCPESLSHPGTSNEGIAADLIASYTCGGVGRLPWKSLGVDQIRDGYGEPLWYAVSTGTWAKTTSATTLTINPSLANQLTYDGTAPSGTTAGVVAVIIAAGRAIDSTADGGTPTAGCAKVNQQGSRYTVPYVVTNFLECGNATGSYLTAGTSPWSNDRSISITANEVMDAIAAAVADRIQRQVVPALSQWETTEQASRSKSWATTYARPYLPYASTFTVPSANDFCGNPGATPVYEGLTPTASSASCGTNWTGNITALLGLISSGCSQTGTELTCSALRLFGSAPFSVTATITAANVAGGFRGTIQASDVTASGGTGGTVTSVVLSSFSTATGTATMTVTATWTSVNILSTVQIHIPNLADGAVLSDSAVTWYTNNLWQQHSYYHVAPGKTLSAATACVNAGDAGCLTMDGVKDRKMVMILTGRAVTTSSTYVQSQPSASPADYLESHTSGTTSYASSTVTSTINDRLAGCPYKPVDANGVTATICN